MATLVKRPTVPPVAPKQAARPVATTKPTTAPKVAKQDGFQVVDVLGTIELAKKAGGGGGKPRSAFAQKVFSLENGQGFKISEEKYGDKGKGIASIYAMAARDGKGLRVRRDVNGQLWLFRVSAEDETQIQENRERRAQERAEQAEQEAAE